MKIQKHKEIYIDLDSGFENGSSTEKVPDAFKALKPIAVLNKLSRLLVVEKFKFIDSETCQILISAVLTINISSYAQT